jgi:hypothetical protein
MSEKSISLSGIYKTLFAAGFAGADDADRLRAIF